MAVQPSALQTITKLQVDDVGHLGYTTRMTLPSLEDRERVRTMLLDLDISQRDADALIDWMVETGERLRAHREMVDAA